MEEQPLALLRLLIARLERISADSYWAHRASGIRGALLNSLENYESGQPIDEQKILNGIEAGYKILLAAALEKTKPRQQGQRYS